MPGSLHAPVHRPTPWRRSLQIVGACALIALSGCANLSNFKWPQFPSKAAPPAAEASAPQAPQPPSGPRAPSWVALSGQPGLLYERDGWEPGQVLHWLQLDLNDPKLRLSLTAPDQRGKALEDFPGAAKAVVALNASFFSPEFQPRGFTVSEGQAWPSVMNATESPLLSCDRQQHCKITLQTPIGVPDGTWLAVAGTPWLIRDGQPRQSADDDLCNFCSARNPRTAVGLDASGRYLTLVLVEGRQPGADGMALATLAARMAARGVYQAINLDGGGSSTLLIDGRQVTGRPTNEPTARRLANALLISVSSPSEAAPPAKKGRPSRVTH